MKFFYFIISKIHKIRDTLLKIADDTKLGTMLDEVKKSDVLRNDLNEIYSWTKKWLICLNEDKCKFLRIGNNNPNNEYHIDNELVSKKNKRKIWVSQYLKTKLT